jgi:hypothetical protein
MKKMTVAVGLAALLAPAAAGAKPNPDKGNVRATVAAEEKAARKNASKECKAERGTIGAQAFAEKYGTNKNRKNAHGKCVSSRARET